MFTSVIDKISEDGLEMLAEYDWIGSSIFWIVISFTMIIIIFIYPIYKIDKKEIIK